MRLGITGGPRTGKSTLARAFVTSRRMCTDPEHLVKDRERGVEYVPSKAVVRFPSQSVHASVTSIREPDQWSLASQYVADHFLTRLGPWVLEGVGLPRALRKWHAAHPGEPPPLERLIILTNKAHVPLKLGQEAMTKGVHTVLKELLPWLGGRVEFR